MKSQAVCRIILMSLLFTASLSYGLTVGALDEPTNVRDYFLLVPERFIGYDRDFREQLLSRSEAGTIIDVKNGFISYTASDNPEAFEFAIFKKADNRYLVAYSVAYDPDFPDTTSKFLLLNYENGGWTDVTKALLPVAFNRRHSYKLPRQGTAIQVSDQNGRRIYTLVWTKSKFLVNGK